MKGNAGLSFSQLSERCLCSRSSLERYLNGRIFPPRDVVVAISDACGGDRDRVLAIWEKAWATRDEQQLASASPRAEAGPPVGAPPPMQLPLDVRNFIGRRELLDTLDGMLGERDSSVYLRIAAIVGTAGVGKTALVTHWAHRVASQFPDGQLWINLHGYAPGRSVTPEHALGVLLRALGVSGSAIPPDLESRSGLFRSLLAGRRVLLVFDNAASVEQVRPLLPGESECFVLVTSRNSLTGLVARDGATRVRVGLLSVDESVALLRKVVGASVVDAQLPDMHAVVALCSRLPLALRIVADRIGGEDSAAVSALISSLSEMSPLDTLDVAGDPYSAVRAVFSWSYRDQPADAAALFRRFGTLPLPDYDEHVSAALLGVPPGGARRLLAVLADAHLVEPRGGRRVHVHDLLRAFAAEQAEAEDSGGTRRAAVDRVLLYYRDMVAAAVDVAFPRDRRHAGVPATAKFASSFSDADAAMRWLDTEWSNLFAASVFAATNGRLAKAVQLANMLGRYLTFGARHGDALTMHRHAVMAAEAAGDQAGLATAIHNLGSTHWLLSQQSEAHHYYEQARDIFRDLGDRIGEARALGNLGNVYWRWGRNDDAYRCYQQARVFFVEERDAHGQAMSLLNLSELHAAWGQYEIAFRHCRQALELYLSVNDVAGEASSRKLMCDIHLRYGRYADALDGYQAALSAGGRLGHRRIMAYALDGMGRVWAGQREYDRAVTAHEQALVYRVEVRDEFGEVDTTGCLGFALYGLGRYDEAIACYQKALDSAGRLGCRGIEPRLLNGIGEVATATGATNEGLSHHGSALEHARPLGDPYEQARAWFGLARANLVLGQRQVATQQADIARTQFARLGVPEGGEVDTWLRQLADETRRDIG